MPDAQVTATVSAERQLDNLLRQCVQCGLCLPHCATWLATGNEVQSPRGRLLLLGEMLPSTEAVSVPGVFLQAFDQCIGCRACETACPSGVPFSLLEYGQQRAVGLLTDRADGLPRPAVPGSVLRRLDRTGFLGFMSGVAGLARGLLAALAGRTWRHRLAGSPAGAGQLVRLLGSMPTSPRTDGELLRMLDGLSGGKSGGKSGGELQGEGRSLQPGPGPRIAFFRGCANAALLPGTSRRLHDLLVEAGCRIEEPVTQDCCGALAAHTGRPGRAADLRGRNREAFSGALAAGAVIVAEAAGCSHELGQYGEDFQEKVIDATVLLAGLDLPPAGRVPLRVVYHDPCHARHGQGIVTEPRQLLQAIPGLELVEPVEAEVCCGSGGAWGLRYPEISADLGRRKAANLIAAGADLVVTSNPGCLGQIADALLLDAPDLPILPLTDLIWYAVQKGM
ncbi:MAG: (Fe-S)-binding protein [Candidatus Krumholzibacteriota bacterium]